LVGKHGAPEAIQDFHGRKGVAWAGARAPEEGVVKKKFPGCAKKFELRFFLLCEKVRIAILSFVRKSSNCDSFFCAKKFELRLFLFDVRVQTVLDPTRLETL
jgi:hypothetical protein